jgi:hypothetical protein
MVLRYIIYYMYVLSYSVSQPLTRIFKGHVKLEVVRSVNGSGGCI